MEPRALEESGEGVNYEQAIPAWLLMTSWVAANPSSAKRGVDADIQLSRLAT